MDQVCACVCVVHETLGERDAEAYLIWVMIQSVARELGYQKEEQPLCWSCRSLYDGGSERFSGCFAAIFLTSFDRMWPLYS